MDEEKKPEALGEEPERLGPYLIQEQVQQSHDSQVELVGACWMPHKLKAPCPETLFEHQGECYAPSFSAKPPPSSLGQ